MSLSLDKVANALAGALAMLLFAGNSVLCRLALRDASMTPNMFTVLRLGSGAVLLAVLVRHRRTQSRTVSGSWLSAMALWLYAAAFSWAYKDVTAATGALLLFAPVQVTMVGVAWARGSRPGPVQSLGLLMALAGVAWLLLPGVTAPPLASAGLMVCAGVAWGVYSMRGRHSLNALADTASNFQRAAMLALAVSVIDWRTISFDGRGWAYALLSGMFASAIGYVLWYRLLPRLKAIQAATLQLCVPVLTTLIGVLFLEEALTARMLVAAALVVPGIALGTMTRNAGQDG